MRIYDAVFIYITNTTHRVRYTLVLTLLRPNLIVRFADTSTSTAPPNFSFASQDRCTGAAVRAGKTVMAVGLYETTSRRPGPAVSSVAQPCCVTNNREAPMVVVRYIVK